MSVDFDKEALEWDDEQKIHQAKRIADEITKSIAIDSSWRALEFGAGTGLISFNLVDVFNHITLIDTSAGMIDVVNTKIGDSGVHTMAAHHTDIETFAQSGQKFDVVFASMALHHIQDIQGTLRHIYNMLNDGGYVCIIDLNEDDGAFHKGVHGFEGHDGFNQVALKGVLKEVGLQDISSRTFYTGERIKDGEKIEYFLFIMIATKKPAS